MDRGTAEGGGLLRLRGRSFGPGELVIMARAGWIPGWRDSGRDEGAAMDRVHALLTQLAPMTGPAVPATR